MQYGAERGYSALYDKKKLIIKPGPAKWLLHTRTMGYSRVEEALSLLRPMWETKKKPATKPRQLAWI
jgi:hypothetical protein